MIGKQKSGPAGSVILAISLVAALLATSAAYAGPIKEIPLSSIGWEVNKETKANFCLFASGDCQTGRESPEPGGFMSVTGVAVNNEKSSSHYGNVYVVDNSGRVQEFDASGGLVSVFPGGKGPGPGQHESARAITIDPAGGAVYVLETVEGPSSTFGARVQKFTDGGEWLWEIGKEVNKTKDGTPGATVQEQNLCTQHEMEEGIECAGPAEYEFGHEPPGNSGQPGVVPIAGLKTLAVGGHEDLLYVGVGSEIQRYHADGSYVGGLALAEPLGSMALDDSCELHEPVLTEATTPSCASVAPSYGDLYVAPPESSTVRKLSADGTPQAEFQLLARSKEPQIFYVSALAVDGAGRVAASEAELGNRETFRSFGSLLSETGQPITEFTVPIQPQVLGSMAFSASGQLYGSTGNEIVSYVPLPVGELKTQQASCMPSAVGSEADVVFTCTLNGQVNPEDVPETEVWFQWGLTEAMSNMSPATPIPIQTGHEPTPVPPPPASSGVPIDGVQPNELVHYRLVGRDRNVKAPELLTGEAESVETDAVPPRVTTAPTTAFVGVSSAVLFDEFNPENDASEYFFEYGTHLGNYCDGPLKTATLKSDVYGNVRTALEATGLQPGTSYTFRLCARNDAGSAVDAVGGNQIPEGTFETARAAVPLAITGAAGDIRATSAIVAGAVNPQGQPATYTFEVGTYQGASTQYVTAWTGLVDASASSTEELVELTGLQPGTEYAYRIAIKGGAGHDTHYGETELFKTMTLPSGLEPPREFPMQVVPLICFPGESRCQPKCKRGLKLVHGRCVKPKRKVSRKRKAKRTHRRHRS